jgi:glyoxylase-like metal-dependent hydrolase (beta-lactamase superfamily II)
MPESMEVYPGIYQLKVPIPDNPLGYLNAYLVRGGDGWLLVDTGWNTEDAFASLEGQLKGLGVGFEDIAHIVVTHLHPDHYGLAGRLKELSPARLYLHSRDAAFIRTRYVDFEDLLRRMAELLRVHGVPEDILPQLQMASMPVQPFVAYAEPDVRLEGGEVLSTGLFDLEVIWSPGHSPGHICLYERQKRILLAGDHILPAITPNISLNVQSGGNPLADYIASLRKMEGLEVDLILPAHEGIFQGLKRRIEEILSHHRERNAAILAALGDGPQTACGVSRQIPWNAPGRVWDKLSPLDKRVAVTETLAHLEWLRGEGLVAKSQKDGFEVFQASRSSAS